jgi:hypothetical protein
MRWECGERRIQGWRYGITSTIGDRKNDFADRVLLGTVVFFVHIGSYDGIREFLGLVSFFTLFCGFPLIISMVISANSKSPFSHIFTMAASLAYVPWFAYVVNVFYASKSSTSALIFIFVGIYFLPILLPLWITAIVAEIRHRRKNKQNPESMVEQS